jgi:hypothetical protein
VDACFSIPDMFGPAARASEDRGEARFGRFLEVVTMVIDTGKAIAGLTEWAFQELVPVVTTLDDTGKRRP